MLAASLLVDDEHLVACFTAGQIGIVSVTDNALHGTVLTAGLSVDMTVDKQTFALYNA